ncbi:MAG TPA: PASTA domain-containing protein [Acidobacteriaceae bacterium]|nr:PASTA domain-containing protein [Acidobacteriaceae bacterium]
MRRFFRIFLGALVVLIVFVLFAGLALRLALHGREVAIPDLSGLTVAQASEAALHSGLDLNIENKFYSRTVPAGRILSQSPAAGSRVRRGWQLRVTESLGPQQVTIPDVVGEPVREASLDLRKSSLDLGTLAHMDAPGDTDMVLAQTPPPDAGVDQPRVNLLLSQQGAGASDAFVMPSFVGMSWTAANRAAIALGLRVAALGEMAPLAQPASAPATASTPAAAPQQPQSPNAGINGSGTPPQIPAPAPVQMVPVGPVTAQSPEPGHRASKGSTVKLTFGHSSTDSSAPSPQPPSPAATPQ